MFNTKERNHVGAPRPNNRHQHPHGGLPPPSRQRSQGHVKSPTNQNASNPAWGERTSATLPNLAPNKPQGRVRVQAGAGDKCVAPAKSKIKRHQGIPGRPVDTSGLSMDSIIWSDETFSVSQLVQVYRNRMPVILKVINGYHFSSGDDLSVNQVVQVHSFSRQKRVRARTDGGGKLSLPADYKMQVFSSDHTKPERWSFSAALNAKSVPFKCQVTSVDESVEVSRVNIVGKQLVVTEKHEEIFLKVNTITEGWIDQDGVCAIPAFLGATFSVAEGMAGASEGEWKDYHEMFARSVRHLDFTLLNGHEGVIAEDDGNGSIQITQPETPEHQGPVYENLAGEKEIRRASTLDPKQRQGNKTHPYENWSKSNIQDNPPQNHVQHKQNKILRNRPTTMDLDDVQISPVSTQRSEVSQTRQDSQDGTLPAGDYESEMESQISPFIPRLPDLISMGQEPRSPRSPVQLSPRPSTPFSEVDEADVEEMFQSVLDVAEEQETLKREKEQHSKNMSDREFRRYSQGQQSGVSEITVPAKHTQDRNSANLQKQNMINSGPPVSPKYANTRVEHLYQSMEDHVVPPSANVIRNLIESNRPSYRSSGSSRDSKEEDIMQSVEVQVHQNPSPRTSILTQATTQEASVPVVHRQDSQQEQDVRKLVSRFQSPRHSQTNLNVSSDSNVSNSLRESMNRHNASRQGRETPRAVVQPTVQQANIVNINIRDPVDEYQHKRHSSLRDFNSNKQAHQELAGRRISGSSFNISTIDDVPKAIETLTVEDVCQCLLLLNMEKHQGTFRKHQVDGSLLSDLSEPVLTKDFHFTPFNASKLMRFVRGWRPKLV